MLAGGGRSKLYYSVEVWFAVLAAMSELGLDTDEKLSALTHAQVVRVVQFPRRAASL